MNQEIRNRTALPKPHRLGWFLLAIGLGTFVAGAHGQPRAIKLVAPAAAAPEAKPEAKGKSADDAADTMKDLAEEKFPGGAALKTDPEQQRLLKRADLCVADGRLDLAAILWQKVLDESGDSLMTRDGRTYTSLSEEVERILSAVDPLALKTYRITADGEAQAILAKGGTDKEEEALATVVRRYFLSSIGDDAAYKLGCHALDRHDFVGASRLFAKILERHPDPSVPRSEILLRLAVASAHVGDSVTAKAAIGAIAQMPGPRPTGEILDLVNQDIADASQTSSLVAATSQNWHMALGNPSRTGRMKGLPAEATSKTLSELWVQDFPLALDNTNQINPQTGMMMGPAIFVGGRKRGGAAQQNPQPVSRESLITQWRQNKWSPTPQLLFDGGRVYIKTVEDLACFPASANSDKPLWRTVWLNQYQLDGMSSHIGMMVQAYGGNLQISSNRPRSIPEVLLFGDRVHQGMTISNGVIYSIEGKRVSKETGPTQQPAAQVRGFQFGVTPRRTRSNWLAAYEAQSGKAKWHRAASDEDKEGSQDVGFLAAPVPYGSLLVAPVTDGGTIWLYGLDSKDGSTVWKAYLCDEPAQGCNPWSPVGLSVEGRDAYVLSGTGVVFNVDAVSGTIRWAVRYQRDGKPNNMMRNFGNNMTTQDFENWEDDVVIPYGKLLVVLASDSDKIVALDRRTGVILWESPRTSPFGHASSYVLGTSGRGLFVAGKNIVRRYDIPSGRLIWEKEIEDSFGHGVLTDDAIYLPVKDSIVKLEQEKGRELIQVGVQLTTDDPVGNLFSDGEKLWVTGGGRVYAMTNLEHRLQILEQKISEGDGEAQLNRMRLHAKAKKFDLVLADLRGSYERFKAKLSPDEAAEKFFAAMMELKLPQQQPVLVLDLLREQFVDAATVPQIGKDSAARRADMLSTSFSLIRQQKVKGLAPQILALAPILDQEYLQSAAAQTLDSTLLDARDIPALEAAVKGEDVKAQLIAAGALAKAGPTQAAEPLKKLLDSADDRVKLAAARALTNIGEKTTLATFVKLLESENPRVRVRSHQSLRALSGQQIAFSSEGKPEERAKSIEAWKAWIEKEGAVAKLTLPLPETDVPLGRTLFVSHVHSMVVELDSNHNERWRVRLPNPWGCQGLPNGNRLIGAYAQNSVIEYSEDGKEVWKKDRLPGPPYSVQRLASGNTLIACADANQIVEVAPDGTTTSINQAGRPICARRLENGNTLIALQQNNRVVEVDKANKVIWEARNMNGPCSCTRLENGNTLIVQMYTGQVVEVDASGGKTVWTAKVPLVNPCDAQRLANGNTLIADNNGLHEIDPTGAEIRWQHKQNNITGVSQF